MIRRSAARPFAALLSAGLSALALATVPARGQERPEDGTVFTGEAHVLAVEVPVQVLAGGEPVRGLTAEDFRVYAGGELRPLTGFEVVDLAITAAPEAAPAVAQERPAALAVPPAGRRHFLLFFDLAFTRAGYLARGIEGARSLVRDGLHPSDLVGVAFYDNRQGVSLALQFTPDRAAVERVLDAFEVLLDGKNEPAAEVLADAGAARSSDPLGLTAGGFGATMAEIGQAAGYRSSGFAEAAQVAGGLGGRVGGFLMDNILAHSAAFSEQTIEEQRSTQAAYLADNLKALAEALRGIEGSKHLVLLSQGCDASLLQVRSGQVGAGTGGGSWLLKVVNQALAELRASGWILHGADLGGIADTDGAGFARQTRAGLFFLADETGGTLVENTNDLATGLEDVLERTSVTYVLTFQVADVAEDGAFHPIRVELADGPRGAQVVHRSGVHAPRPAGERQPFERRAEAAARLLAGDEVGGLPAAVRATSFAYAGETARVPGVVEVPGSDLLKPGAGGAAELYVYAFDGDGAVADFFANTVTFDAANAAGATTTRGVKLAGELELPPGRYEIRALVRGAGAGPEAMRTFALEVPPVLGDPGLLPPLFVQGGGERWTVAALGDGRAGDGAGDGPYPFVVEGKRISPAAVPVLAPGQAARLLLPGVGLTREGVRVETRIIGAAGEPVPTGRLTILGQRSPEPGQPDLLVAELDPQALPPGAYRVEVTLAGTGHRVSAPFRVGG
ncbi:MAG TPA: VWA domain-containing protein [Thermoanaerobaculia bacterium]|nr:VWA domain-containing protein [Thermoanaerobaculia bacterium]